jgi:integrase
MNSVYDRNRALCAAWLDWLAKHRRRRPLTVYQYAGKLDKLCQYAGDRPLGSLHVMDLEAFVGRQRRSGQAGADATVQRDVVVLRGLYGWANEQGHLSQNPAANLSGPTVKNHNPKAIPDELWAKVWRAELTSAMRVMLGLGYYCGLRREEICRLQAKHFIDGRIMHFPRKGDRNDKNSGVIPFESCARLYAEKRPDLLAMPEDFLLPLADAVSAASPWVLPWGGDAREPLRRRPSDVGPPPGMTNPDVINRRLGVVLVRLGLARSAFTPHALRHSFVTNLLGMGVPLVDVSHLANHSDVNITMKYYRVAEDPLAQFLGKPLHDGNRW